MKRYGALAISLCLLLTALCAVHAEEFVLGDRNGLEAHQSALDKIRENLAYAETAGYRALNVQLSLMEEGEGLAEQVSQTAGTVTITGGVHYIEEPAVLNDVVLENDAVLLNFGATVNNILVGGTAQYYCIGANGARNITLTDISLAYLQDAVGETIIAGGQSEVLLLGAVVYNELFTADMASLAVLGNVNIATADQQSTGRIFDPNQMLPVHPPASVAGGNKTTGGGGGGSSKPKEEGPYPDYLIEWVFGSDASSNPEPRTGDETCNCCGCTGCTSFNKCCTKCKCISYTLIK